MLTAKGEDMDKILGLEYGADDYMTKPFNILEVKARIKTILRRVGASKSDEKPSTVTVRDLTVNFNNRSVSVAGRDVNLTAKEFDLLQLFITNRGKVFSREMLMESIWKYELPGRSAYGGRTHTPSARKDREEPRAAHVYLHQVGSGLLFHGQRLKTYSRPCAGGCSCCTC